MAELCPEGGEQAAHLRRVIGELFGPAVPAELPAGRGTLLAGLAAGIAAQLRGLDDPGLTEAGEAAAAGLGVSGVVLADRLTTQLFGAIYVRGAGGGSLAALASQLNHERILAQGEQALAQGEQTEAALTGLAAEVREALAQLSREAPGWQAEFPQARAAYLARVRQRYQRVDLEVLTPLSEQGEHPAMLLGEIFVPQWMWADPPPVELPRELWRRLAEAGEVRDENLPEGVGRERVEQAWRAHRDRPAVPVLDVAAGAAGRRRWCWATRGRASRRWPGI